MEIQENAIKEIKSKMKLGFTQTLRTIFDKKDIHDLKVLPLAQFDEIIKEQVFSQISSEKLEKVVG